MGARGLWIKLLLLILGLLSLQGVQAQCKGSELYIIPENVADVEACASLDFMAVYVMDNVTSVDLSNLTFVSSLTVEGGSLQSLAVPNLQSVDHTLTLRNIRADASITFSSYAVAWIMVFDGVVFPISWFPVLQKVEWQLEIFNCSGTLSDETFPALSSVGEVNIQDIEKSFTVTGLNCPVTGNVYIKNVHSLTLTGLNGNITANKFELVNLQNSLISGFNGNISCATLLLERGNNTQVSGFNGPIETSSDLIINTWHSSVISGFNGSINIGALFRIFDVFGSQLSSFNGSVTVGDEVYFASFEHTLVSGFNGPLSCQAFWLVGCYEAVVSGFNGGLESRNYLDVQGSYNTDFSGFNGPATARTINVDSLVACRVSGFNGHIAAPTLSIEKLYGATELSGFNGIIEVDTFLVETFGSFGYCGWYCDDYLDQLDYDYVAQIDNNTLVKFSGFNGQLKAPDFYIMDVSSRLEIDGFKGQVLFETMNFLRLQSLTVLPGSFAALHALPSSANSSFSNVADEVYQASINMEAVTFLQPSDTLLSAFHAAQPTPMPSHVSTAYDFSVDLYDVFGLSAIDHCFNGIEWSSQLSLHTLVGLAAVKNSWTDLRAVHTLSVENTSLIDVDVTSFSSLKAVSSLNINGNPDLISVDGLLSLANTEAILIANNPSLRSLSGLCGLVPRAHLSVDITNNTALCCADLAAIFDAALYNDSTISLAISDCNSSPSCELGSRYVCECDSFKSNVCSNGDFCTDVRFGAQCLTCQAQEIFNSSTSKCQDCGAAAFPDAERTACVACSVFGATCTSCNASGCMACAQPTVNIDGVCQACSVFGAACTSCDAAGCTTCAQPTVNINGTCQACSVFGPACTSCNASGCHTCAQPATNVDGVCRVCDLGCQNNGKCTLSKSGQFCACPAGFGGALCEQKQSFDVVTETKQSTSASKKRSHFAVNKPFVVDTLVAKPANVTLVDVDLLQVTVAPNGVVLYEPVIGQSHSGQRTVIGTEAALNFTYNAATRNLQVTFSPLVSFLGSKSSADIKVKVEFLLSYTVGPVASKVSKKVAVMRTVAGVPSLQSSDVYTTTITVEQAVTLYPTEEAADEAQNKADHPEQPANKGSDSSLSGGAVAGIVIGSVVGAIVLLSLGVFCMRRSSRNAKSSSQGAELAVVAKA